MPAGYGSRWLISCQSVLALTSPEITFAPKHRYPSPSRQETRSTFTPRERCQTPTRRLSFSLRYLLSPAEITFTVDLALTLARALSTSFSIPSPIP